MSVARFVQREPPSSTSQIAEVFTGFEANNRFLKPTLRFVGAVLLELAPSEVHPNDRFRPAVTRRGENRERCTPEGARFLDPVLFVQDIRFDEPHARDATRVSNRGEYVYRPPQPLSCLIEPVHLEQQRATGEPRAAELMGAGGNAFEGCGGAVKHGKRLGVIAEMPQCVGLLHESGPSQERPVVSPNILGVVDQSDRCRE